MFNVFGKKKSTSQAPDNVQNVQQNKKSGHLKKIASKNQANSMTPEAKAVIAQAHEKAKQAELEKKTLAQNISRVAGMQSSVQQDLSATTRDSEETGASSQLTVEILDRQVMDDNNPLMVTLYNTMLDKMKGDDVVSNIITRAVPLRDSRERFVYHIADSIRHGSKDNFIRIYGGPIAEKGFGTKVESFLRNAVRINQKTLFLKPQQLTAHSQEENDFIRLTGETIDWTIKKYF